MRRALRTLLTAAAMFGTVASTADAQATMIVAPTAAAQTDTFIVDGEGLPPLSALDISFIAPDGTVLIPAEILYDVDEQGDFELVFVPAETLGDVTPGPWTLRVCGADTGECVEGAFEIV